MEDPLGSFGPNIIHNGESNDVQGGEYNIIQNGSRNQIISGISCTIFGNDNSIGRGCKEVFVYGNFNTIGTGCENCFIQANKMKIPPGTKDFNSLLYFLERREVLEKCVRFSFEINRRILDLVSHS